MHHVAQFLQIGAIDGQGQRFAQERILNVQRFRFERNQAILARLGGVADQFLNSRIGRLRRVEEHMHEPNDRALEYD